MKHLKLILCFLIILLFESTLLAQPYIYFSKVIDSTDSNPMYWQISINRLNLNNNLEETFLYDAEFISYTWDITQTWLILDRPYWYSHAYNCLDTLNNFDLPADIGGGVFPVLYSKEKNTLFITGVSEDKLKMFEFNVITKDFTQSFEEFPQIIHNNKEGMFFSLSEEKIYVPVLDTNYSGMGKLLIYSTTSKHILSISDLSVYGYPNANGYILYKGKDGIAVLLSYFHNITKDSYFRVYNFDSDLGSNFIKYQGFADPYYISKGKYLILANIYDSLNAYSGKLDIYDVGTGEHIKNIFLPTGGEVYTFDEFPNNVYYVKDIELPTRQVWNLNMDSIFNVLDLTSLNPNSVNIGSNTFTLTVKGKGFDSVSTVYFNGQEKLTTFISDSVLSAEITAYDVSFAGSFPVWVKDKYSISDTLLFTVNQPANPNLVVSLKNSLGNQIPASNVMYYEGSWKDAVNNGDGTFTVITTKPTVSIRMFYEYANQTVHNVPAQNNTYTFTTVNAAVELRNSSGSLIDAGTVQYYAGAWRSFGTTVNGVANKELLPINYSFRMTYEYVSLDKQQDISTNSTVTFSTVLCTVKVTKANGQPLSSASTKYYSGAWRDIGLTNTNGEAAKELLPKSLNFRAASGSVSQDKQQDIGVNNLVEIQLP
ncbi:MAG: hypothetical protein M5U17_08340 [Ignavibacterium sp.]|nr:hypothetical protein [Ignavibacterium sp.]